jgi:hypothetical protein
MPRMTRRLVAALGIGLVVVGCALPATEEGFNQGFCEADAAFEVATAAVLEIEDRQEWIAATREAMLTFRDDLDRLPAWAPARDAKAQLMAALDAVLDLVESGAAGELIESPRWEDAIETMLTARAALRTMAGPCLRLEGTPNPALRRTVQA